MRLPEWFSEPGPVTVKAGVRVESAGFIEKNLTGIAGFMKGVMEPEEFAKKAGLLQALDPRARIAGAAFLILAAALMGSIPLVLGVIVLTAFLTGLSLVAPGALVKRVLPSFVFTSIIVLPVFLSFISPGTEVFVFKVLGQTVAVTVEGIKTGLLLLVRVTSMVALVALLLLTTTQPDLFRGLRSLPIPGLFVTALFMTFRYIFILLKIAEDSNLARKSRTISRRSLRESQGWVASRIALLVERSLKVAEDVNMAMASRGFKGEVKTIEEYTLSTRDYLWLGCTSFVFFLSFGT